MNPAEEIGERLVRVEVKLDNIEADVVDIRADVRELKALQVADSAGLTRPERIALAAAGSAVIGAVIGVIALLTSGPGP